MSSLNVKYFIYLWQKQISIHPVQPFLRQFRHFERNQFTDNSFVYKIQGLAIIVLTHFKNQYKINGNRFFHFFKNIIFMKFQILIWNRTLAFVLVIAAQIVALHFWHIFVNVNTEYTLVVQQIWVKFQEKCRVLW